jgi:hypothetical protein
MSAGPRYGTALFVLLAALAPAANAQSLAAPTTTACEEDRPTGEPPTISSRFDLKDPGEGVAFAAARARAAQYCTRQACTIDGKSTARQASIYALGILHRRYIAGFRCVPAAGAASEAGTAAPLAYPLGDPSEIDAAHADADAHCAAAHVKAELADLRKKDGGFVAVFACGS